MKLSEILNSELEEALKTISRVTTENNCECFLMSEPTHESGSSKQKLSPHLRANTRYIARLEV